MDVEKEENIITIEEINKLLSDYNIGKKPLAKLLGWGEITIIRYIQGDLPTIEYSNKLKHILYYPNYYYYILQCNKDYLTDVAFEKSKKAVLNKLMDKKIHIVTQYIININHGVICPLYMQVLLYYIQGFSLALNGTEMFSDEYRINSPQIPYLDVYNRMIGSNVDLVEINEGGLTEKEKTLITNVVESFSWYGRNLFHAMMTYDRTLLKVTKDGENHKIIAKETIKTYFMDILEQTNINGDNELYKYPDKRFVEIKYRNRQ